MKEKLWEVYIILTESGMLYTGITNDLDRRFASHLEGKKGARFFRFSKPLQIAYRESYKNRSEASQREYIIKKMSRQQKFKMINQFDSQNNKILL
jgi:putative endonuclease